MDLRLFRVLKSNIRHFIDPMVDQYLFKLVQVDASPFWCGMVVTSRRVPMSPLHFRTPAQQHNFRNEKAISALAFLFIFARNLIHP